MILFVPLILGGECQRTSAARVVTVHEVVVLIRIILSHFRFQETALPNEEVYLQQFCEV